MTMKSNTEMVDKLIAEITNKDHELSSEGNSGGKNTTGRWTRQEHLLFVKALQRHGKRWGLVQSEIPNRTASQIRTHAQKFFIKLSYILPDGIEPIAFMRTKPATFFLDLPNHPPAGIGKKRFFNGDVPDPIPNKTQPVPTEYFDNSSTFRRNEHPPFNSLSDVRTLAIQSEVITTTLSRMLNELQILYQSFKNDMAKREPMLRASPYMSNYWRFILECLERLNGLMIATSVCQQESTFASRPYILQPQMQLQPKLPFPLGPFDRLGERKEG